ncbi:MAG: ABC-2 transporter permease [Candidatus Cellulosilyticum pullistercoris]|uniref:ABC-2 transporter permease n=1 Tax=Candidatus Cellulosilyticum pullistercoris TaxID=2838521 RepID=A0A9E2NNF7_9FIRM|nr:ABC-2 transporter permease [Candidatus Cellulosilyticum pullistercoris]
MIWELVKKDIIFLVASLKSTLLSIILLALCLPLTGIGFGIVTPALVCYVGFYGVLAYEERSKMHLLNLALPVTRKEICISRYVYAIGLVIFMTILSSIGSILGVAAIGKEDLREFVLSLPFYMILMFSIAILYLSVMIPCIFKWGTIKARYILVGIYVVILIGSGSINGVVATEKISESLNRYLSGHNMLLLIIGALICWVISLKISLKIWEKKDVN